MSSQNMVFVYILDIECLIHVLVVSYNSYMPKVFFMMVECGSEGLLCVAFVLLIIMAYPDAKDILFGQWFPPRALSSTRFRCALSSTRFRYGTTENGAAGTEFASNCYFYT